MRIKILKNNQYLQLLSHLNKSQKKGFFIFLFLISFGAILEIFNVIAIVPFLNILSGEELPDLLISFLSFIRISVNTYNQRELIFNISALVIIITLFSAFYRVLITVLKENYIARISNFLSTKAFDNILAQKYDWHLNNESSELIVKLDGIDAVAAKIISPIFSIFTAAISSIVILIGMLSYDFRTTVTSLFTVGSIYILFLQWCKDRLDANSIGRIKAQKDLLKIKKDSLNGIREIIINNENKFIIDPYRNTDKRLRNYHAEIGYLSLCPRYIIEFLSVFIIVLVGLIAFYNSNKSDSLLTIFGFFGITLLKLIPHIQSFYTSITSLRANKRNLYEFLELLSLRFNYSNIYGFKNNKNVDKFIIKNLSFNFSREKNYLFKDINLELNKGDFIVLTGESGSGKTTLCDILMGLIEATDAEYFFKSGNNTHKVFSYDLRKHSVHVPQQIFLYNDSVTKNITRSNIINKDALKIAISTSCLEDFVNNLPNGLDSDLGERGSLISGGQRQRIGLARAIYKLITEDKSILFLDEFTSALDKDTEIEVIKKLQFITKENIIIAISHRKNTFKYFNRVINLNNLRNF